MYRDRLERIYELKDQITNPESSKAYFHDFENSIETNPVKLKIFIDIEKNLQGLAPTPWKYLKRKLVHLFENRNPLRGWQAAYDILNEAKGYNHLISLGCEAVEFIPISRVKGKRTPDLTGKLKQQIVLCEVKTINISDDEVRFRRENLPRDIQVQLPPLFFSKLKSVLVEAKNQMDCFASNDSIRKIAYVVISFDDILNQYVKNYSEQLDSFVSDSPISGIEIFFDYREPYYSATA